jgi:hypothetical protein
LVVIGTTLAEFVRGALFVLMWDPYHLSNLKSLMSNIESLQILGKTLHRLTRPRDDRHFKAGSPAGKD